MAAYFGENATKRLSSPVDHLQMNAQDGKVRVAYDKYEASGALSLSDTITFGRLPKGARVIDAYVKATDLGDTGDLDIGWSAGANGDEAGDADGFFVALDVNAAAAVTRMGASAPGFFKEFAEEVDIVATVVEATTAAGTIEVCVLYVVD